MPVLHSWRRAWRDDVNVTALGDEADKVVAERNKVALAEPSGDIFAGIRPAVERCKELCRSDAVGSDEVLRECQTTLFELDPFIAACIWQRWLRLEEALGAELRSGSLTGSALILRTMMDELGVILTVRNASSFSSSATLADVPGIYKYMGFLERHVLPHTLVPTDSEMQVQLNEDIKLPPALEQSRQSLNDYVHPNHGSNEVALHPEESVAGRVVLAVIVSLYQAAIQLMPRTESPAASKRTASRLKPTDEWKRLLNETGPSLVQFGRKRYGAETYFPDLNSLRFAAREELVEVHVARYARELRLLIRSLRAGTKAARAPLASFPNRIHDLGFPTQEAWMVTLPAARLLAGELEAIVEGPPVPEEWNEATRFRYLAASMELTVLATQYKTKAIALSLARMLNLANPLGSVLMARSLIEHHAVATHLESVVTALLDGVQAGPVFDIDSLESSVVMFLCGTKRTAERTGAVRQRWLAISNPANRAIRLMKAVNGCFDERDVGRVLYNVFSNYIHGLHMPSGDLVRPGSLTNENLVLYKALYVLARFSPFVPGGDATFGPIAAMQRLRRIADGLEHGATTETAIPKSRPLQSLIETTDFIGSGSEDNPFRFRVGLDYHETFYAFCNDHHVEGTRIAWRYGTSGWGDRVELEDGDLVFFANAPY